MSAVSSRGFRMVPDLMRRIYGSDDHFPDSPPALSPTRRALTSHDGFTLYDLVAYNQKHSWANGRTTRTLTNYSWCGYEGRKVRPSMLGCDASR
jgi:glycogen operon protein